MNSEIRNQNLSNNTRTDLKYRAFHLTIEVIKFTEGYSAKPVFRVIIDQLVRAISSIGANIVEAKSSASKREFLNFFQIALKSANESKYWLAILREMLPETKEKINLFIAETDEICKMLSSSVLTLKGHTKL